MSDYLVDTNILIYHTHGFHGTEELVQGLISRRALNVSIVMKIEFLGWDKHTTEGLAKCRDLISYANVYPLDDEIAERAIALRTEIRIGLADAVIAATALVNGFALATTNSDDFKRIAGLEIVNPLA